MTFGQRCVDFVTTSSVHLVYQDDKLVIMKDSVLCNETAFTEFRLLCIIRIVCTDEGLGRGGHICSNFHNRNEIALLNALV